MATAHSVNNHGYLFVFAIPLLLVVLENNAAAEWFNHGGDLTNRRNPVLEPLINPISTKNLRLRWKFVAGFDISATPSIVSGVIYFPSWNGNLYAVNAINGALIWKQNIGQLTGLPGTSTTVNVSVSRSTPTVDDDLLIVGIYGPAVVIALRRLTGKLVCLTKVDPGPLSLITASGTAYLGLVKLDIRTGAILWQTYTIPDNGGRVGGYSGAAIWGSSPPIDISRGLVYAGTGNLYLAPEDVLQCLRERNNQTKPSGPEQCFGPDIHFFSIFAFDIKSGKIVWSTRLEGYDVFYFVCLVPNNPDCPPGPNLDADFGEAPMLLSINPNGTKRDVVAVVQKSGFAWALDRDNGDIVWFKMPILEKSSGPPRIRATRHFQDQSLQPMEFSLQALASNGPVDAMDAKNGNILRSYNTGASVYGGASVSYGCVYIGHGYSIGLANFHPTGPVELQCLHFVFFEFW
ncbi:hypothetical protein LIER_18185 [Lithospermum erythrorhizon]|uniref:Pyrrolo-quinoline quinone repeat domain-containing protein n=1 Tax=Lithospermum erythrorhizon TaxID=34254 RepID=A0AAV3QD16_LITER